ncbi:MAG: hypothetical protein LBK54_06480 [Propionibacteriaceae bacterium]|jgi:hypothetical protein|nr:hypothetical protein [Propionibacteriaceae bacterium]
MTIDGVAWPNSAEGEWLYGVYRSNGTDWVRVDASGFVGADMYRLMEDDLLMWQYGPAESYDSLFPTILPPDMQPF